MMVLWHLVDRKLSQLRREKILRKNVFSFGLENSSVREFMPGCNEKVPTVPWTNNRISAANHHPALAKKKSKCRSLAKFLDGRVPVESPWHHYVSTILAIFWHQLNSDTT